jgi:hypothetical protein
LAEFAPHGQIFISIACIEIAHGKRLMLSCAVEYAPQIVERFRQNKQTTHLDAFRCEIAVGMACAWSYSTFARMV